MNWGIAAAISAVIGVPMLVIGIYYTARAQAREQASARAKELQDRYNRGVFDGQALIAPEVNLAKSQRDEARRERDNERSDRLDAERLVETRQRRIEELTDQINRLRGNN